MTSETGHVTVHGSSSVEMGDFLDQCEASGAYDDAVNRLCGDTHRRVGDEFQHISIGEIDGRWIVYAEFEAVTA